MNKVITEADLGPRLGRTLKLAGAAMYWAMSRDLPKAMRYVKTISDETGGEGIGLALCAWGDAYADHATDGDPGGRPAEMTMLNAQTGQAERIADSTAPAEVKWAASWVHARASQDHDRCQALLAELPHDGRELTGYIAALLQSVAETMNGLPRGFARMGQRRR